MSTAANPATLAGHSADETAPDFEDVMAGFHPIDRHDAAIEHWLQTEVAATYDEVMADPSRLLSHEEVWASLDAMFDACAEKVQTS